VFNEDLNIEEIGAVRTEYSSTLFPMLGTFHGQKWINMTFKYIFVMGERRIAGFFHLYDFCHVPIDEYLLAALPKDFVPLGCRWSRLDNYELYLDRQQWIRWHDSRSNAARPRVRMSHARAMQSGRSQSDPPPRFGNVFPRMGLDRSQGAERRTR